MKIFVSKPLNYFVDAPIHEIMLESGRKDRQDRLRIRINSLRAERVELNKLLREIQPFCNSDGAHYLQKSVEDYTNLIDHLEKVRMNC